jgi:hypothetical protein
VHSSAHFLARAPTTTHTYTHTHTHTRTHTQHTHTTHAQHIYRFHHRHNNNTKNHHCQNYHLSCRHTTAQRTCHAFSLLALCAVFATLRSRKVRHNCQRVLRSKAETSTHNRYGVQGTRQRLRANHVPDPLWQLVWRMVRCTPLTFIWVGREYHNLIRD